MHATTGATAPSAGAVTVGSPEIGSTAGESPDPTTFPAFVVAEVPKFDWQQSGYVRSVLAEHKELVRHADGTFSRDEKPMLDRLEKIVRERIVTPDNLDEAAYLGVDHGDLLSLVYGRPAAEALEYREETAFLVSKAWAAISPKGTIAKRLDVGEVMVQSPKDTLSRIVTNADGTQSIQPVVVRMVTTVPENMLNYALSPASMAALAAVRKAVRLAKDGIHNFEGAKELFGNRLMLLNNELNAALADGLEKAGYALQPSKVSVTGALTSGSGNKKGSAKDVE